MPVPSKNEKEKDFIDRCIPIVMKDGTAKDNKQAYAICLSIWEEKKKGKKEMRIKTGILMRQAFFEREAANKEERTIPLSFSSEEPIERFFGVEILDHSPESIRMNRAKRGLPLLINHNRDGQIGIVEDISLGGDRKGRGKARFGKSAQATEIFNDVLDGIRKDTSVGYRIHEMVLEKQEEDLATYRATDWEPMEISLVAVPADIQVGVGRGEGDEFEVKVQKKKEDIPKMDKCTKCGTDLVGGICYTCRQADAVRQEGEKEKIRVSDIMAMGQEMAMLDKAIEFVRDGKTINEFSALVIKEARKKLGNNNIQVGHDRAEDKPFKEFPEFLYCVRYVPNDPRLRPLWNENVGKEYARAMSMGVGTAGGFALPSQFKQELLQVGVADAAIRPRSTVIPAGDPPDSAIDMPALDQGTTHGMNAGFTGGWIAEGGTKPEQNVFLRLITLEPHEYAAHLVVTDKLLRNWGACASTVEMLARRSIMMAEEMAFIGGTGAGQPLGFVNPLNTGAITVTRNGANAVAFIDTYSMFARLYGSVGVWFASKTILTQLIPMVDAGSNLIWQPSAREGEPATLYGLPIYFHDRMPPLGSRGDLCLVNLQYYLIKDGSGPFFGASDQVFYTTNKTVFKIFWNVDGQPWLKEPLPLEGGAAANTVSPFVILQ